MSSAGNDDYVKMDTHVYPHLELDGPWEARRALASWGIWASDRITRLVVIPDIPGAAELAQRIVGDHNHPYADG